MANRPDTMTSRGRKTAIAVVCLAFVEVVWLVWFVLVPLPNTERKLTRGALALVALPGIGEPSTIGAGLAKLSRWEFLPQRLPILACAAWIGIAAIASGLLVLRGLKLRGVFSRAERLALAFGVGMALLGSLTLLAGRWGILGVWQVRIALAVPLVWELLLRGWKGPDSDRLAWSFPGLLGWACLVAPFLVTSLLAAMLPTIDYDALEYHLQAPKEFFQSGRVEFLNHNVYASMPLNVEMGHLLGMHVINDWWLGALVGQVLIWAYSPCAAVLIAAAATRAGSARAGFVGALAYLVTPWVSRMASLPYVEGPLMEQHAALVGLAFWSRKVDGPKARRAWVLLGLIAGSALATKYPALISAVLPFGGLAVWDAVRRRSPMVAAAFACGVLAISGPWLTKNVVDHGNPVYPLAVRVFGGHPWSEAREAKWSAGHGPKPIVIGELSEAVIDVAGRSDWQSFLYAALAPLALARPGSRRFAVALLAYVTYIFATWWLFTHRLDRFWLPLLPGLAVLAGLGADWTKSPAWSFVLAPVLGAGVFLGLAYSWTDLVGLNDWTADLRLLRSSVPRQLNAPLLQLDMSLPVDAKPLLIGQAAIFHMNHALVYNTVFDDEVFEMIAKGRTPEEVGRGLAERGISHVYVDWQEVERHRKPGGYGFTDFVQPAVFDGLVAAGVLGPPVALDPGARRLLYEVFGPQPQSATRSTREGP